MVRRLTIFALLALAVALGGSFEATPAQAKPTTDKSAGPSKRASSGKTRRKKKRAKRRKKKANMPRNWVWPPDKAMRAAGAACLEELTELGVSWEKAKAARKVATPVIVPDMNFVGLKLTPIFRKPPFVLDCHLARAIAHAAPAILASDVTELRFSTIHEYRRVRLRGRTLNALSRHSLGLAVDVYELVTGDGTKIVIEDDYRGSAHAHAVEATLLESGQLRALLTPGNDPRSHNDHFHLEASMEIPAKPPAKKQASRASK